MAYLYRHIRLDKNEPFYIGIGSDEKFKRANEKSRRNKIWNDIVSKTDYKIEILFDNLTWEQACEKEIELVSFYGRRDLKKGTLCNLTDGGDGTLGVIQSEESRRKKSESQKGKKASEEARKKMSQAQTGKKPSEETRKKMSDAKIGKKLGIKFTEETRKKMSENSKGKNSKKVINTETKENYNSAKEAWIASGLKCQSGHFISMLNGRKKNKTNFKYV
jgi:hypothetical protein